MVSGNAISLIIAGVSLVGTIAIAIFSAWKQQSLEDLKHNREVNKEVKKYSGPLAVAAWELQERLFDLVDTEISDQHVHNPAGYQNLALMSSFLLAQYLAWAFILREKTQFLSFTGSAKWKRLRMIMYKIDDELDRNVDRKNGVFGHFPANRLWVSEKALRQDGDTLRSIRWDEFTLAWETDFKPRLAWYTDQIVTHTVVAKATGATVSDERLRRLQHQLVDLLKVLDTDGVLQDGRPSETLRCGKSRWCDCEDTQCKPGLRPWTGGRTRRERHDSYYGAPKPLSASTREKLQLSAKSNIPRTEQPVIDVSEKISEEV